MRGRKPLTDEQLRILRAAANNRLFTNEAGRWVVPGEARPDRKSREALEKRGYIEPGYDGRLIYVLTSLGYLALAEAAVGERTAA